MFRYAKDVYNPLTNSFTSQLQLYGDTNAVTGEYACFSSEYQDVQKKIYIYWQGISTIKLTINFVLLRDNKCLFLIRSWRTMIHNFIMSLNEQF